MDEPMRHREINAVVVARARRMTPAERLEVAAGITDAVMELARAGRTYRENAWRHRPSTKS